MTGIERPEFLADVLADNEKYGAGTASTLREIADGIGSPDWWSWDLGDAVEVLRWVADYGGLDAVKRMVPDLGADRKPICRFDEVWTVDGDGPYHVCSAWQDGTVSLVEKAWRIRADQLTHTNPEPPDTWERIEEDAGCTATEYNERRGTIFTTKQQVARDLVRRCRALAERG